MKDPTIPSATTRKKFMFYDSEQRQAQLKIRCEHDGINQSQFFRMMITGYLKGDESILNYIDSFKEQNKIQGRAKRTYINKMHREARDLKKKFSTEEIESIFDILEDGA